MSQQPVLPDRPLHVGASVSRVEDDRLLRGGARYVADVEIPNMAEVTIVRSPLAHAELGTVDLEPATRMPGVIAAFGASDMTGVQPFPDTNPMVRPVSLFPLARDRVRYVGAPVAVVVAEDRYLAEDAAAEVWVDYEQLPAVMSVEASLDGSQRLYDEWPDNKVLDFQLNDPEIDRIFRNHHVVRETYSTHRHTGVPLETRGCVAQFDGSRITLWSSTQSPHYVRTILGRMLGLSENRIRVIAPDMGGGFGIKSHMYPEEVLVPWLAIKLGRPVRWIEDRTEHFTASNHAREQAIHIEGAFTDAGRIVAVRAHIVSDVGSGEIWFPGTGPSIVAAGMLTGPYRISRTLASITCAVTNKTPAGAYRGYGQPEGVFALESLMDKAAIELGLDPVGIRRTNLIRRQDLPFTSFGGSVFDSGSFREAFDKTVETAREAHSSALDKYRDDDEVRIGVGFATYWEGTSPSGFLNTGLWGAHDSASVRVEPDGGIVVSVGVTTTGQGVETMVATLAADILRVPLDRVRVEMGDTDTCPAGQGGWASRSTVMGGGAVVMAAGRIRDKMMRTAAHALEADVDDIVVAEDRFEVRGTQVGISFAEVAGVATVSSFRLPEDIEAGLDTTAVYTANVDHWPDELGRINPCPTYANASHAAVVKVELSTGAVAVLQYVSTHDCGPVINPRIVRGQVEGGIAQGIGGTLLENLVYSDEGQLLSASFMDYLIPTAHEIPDMVVQHLESPSPNTPLGVKGVGEGGVIGVPAAVANAVRDALAEFGVEITELPLSPSNVRRLIRKASAAV
ncbi:MAG: xanthine dehydrogenase family protein molybdopterin-binding subunit [bacterium]|nr:xanthine dehydrogenase family protein molybdopterin-binding subunit [bacterium]MDE0289720.1 xanthine dehydrogenase family protein molybdopterin-binding subunit [bacterium]MDE0440175.1 xanthine dehydrogenase family protein molybdopterin-binding subunit [bacterium]